MIISKAMPWKKCRHFLKLIKTSEDNVVADILFIIKGENYRKTVKTNANGEILLSDLVPGTYTVTESVDERYEPQQPKTVKVEAENTATVTFKNILKKGDLKIIKVSEDSVVADIEFTVTGKNFKQTVKTDSKGEIGKGTHSRFIIDPEKFMKKLEG